MVSYKALPLGLGKEGISNIEFLSESDLHCIVGQVCSVSMDSEYLGQLWALLKIKVAEQILCPIKTINNSDSHMLIFWETWGIVTQVYDCCKAKIGIYSWDTRYPALPERHIPTKHYQTHLLDIAKDNFSIVATYRAWIESILNEWAITQDDSLSRRIACNPELIKSLGKSLSAYFSEHDALSTIATHILKCDEDKLEIGSQFPLTVDKFEAANIFVAVTKIPFHCSKFERNAARFFAKLIQSIPASMNESFIPKNANELMVSFGITQNARIRIRQLSVSEISSLIHIYPNADKHLPFFLSELNRTLQRMHLIHKQYPHIERPSLNFEAAKLLGGLAILRYESNKWQYINEIQFSQLINSIYYFDKTEGLQFYIEEDHTGSKCRVLISSVITLLELLLDAQLMPPPSKEYIPIDQFEFFSTADWFIHAKPILNKQQIKSGWKYIDKQVTKWHDNFTAFEYEKPDYTEWFCPIMVNYENWQKMLPENLKYKLIPLTNSYALYEETKAMEHCVVTYDCQCIEGDSRVFSVRKIASGKRVATAEIRKVANRWQLGQLKGKNNIEMVQQMDSSITTLINSALNWYNNQNSYSSLIPHNSNLTRIESVSKSHPEGIFDL